MQIELSVHASRAAAAGGAGQAASVCRLDVQRLMHSLLPQAGLETIVEGAELTGVVTRMMLYHGAQVDLGTVYDGCARALLRGLATF